MFFSPCPSGALLFVFSTFFLSTVGGADASLSLPPPTPSSPPAARRSRLRERKSSLPDLAIMEALDFAAAADEDGFGDSGLALSGELVPPDSGLPGGAAVAVVAAVESTEEEDESPVNFL